MSEGLIGQVNASIGEFAANSDSMDKIAAYARACWTPEKKGETPAQLKKCALSFLFSLLLFFFLCRYSVDALVTVAYFVQKIAMELDNVLSAQVAIIAL